METKQQEIIDLSTDSDDERGRFDKERYDAYMTQLNYIKNKVDYMRLAQTKRLDRKLWAETSSITDKTDEEWELIMKLQKELKSWPQDETKIVEEYFEKFNKEGIVPNTNTKKPTFSVRDALLIIEKIKDTADAILNEANVIDVQRIHHLSTKPAEKEYDEWDDKMYLECKQFLHCPISHVCFKYAEIKLRELLDNAARKLRQIRHAREKMAEAKQEHDESKSLKRERDDVEPPEEQKLPEQPRRSARNVERVFYGKKPKKIWRESHWYCVCVILCYFKYFSLNFLSSSLNI